MLITTSFKFSNLCMPELILYFSLGNDLYYFSFHTSMIRNCEKQTHLKKKRLYTNSNQAQTTYLWE